MNNLNAFSFRYKKPLPVLALMAVSIFVIDTGVRQLVHILDFSSPRLEALISTILLTVLFAPVAYLIVRPVLSLEAEHKQVDKKLQKSMASLRKTMGGIVQAMALTLERRDPYTAGHSRRVTDIARSIATKMGLSKEQINAIRMAGTVHDLGKICIPAEILIKPGRLSKKEFRLIQTHPRVGADILKTIDFPWPLAQTVLQHHERMDGSGYPNGLSGNAILLDARIVAVADVVEAMASDRPYRLALGIEKALEEISRNKNILYDPEVVDTCLELFAKDNFSLD